MLLREGKVYQCHDRKVIGYIILVYFVFFERTKKEFESAQFHPIEKRKRAKLIDEISSANFYEKRCDSYV